VTAALPPTSIEALRDEVERLTGHIAKYLVHEPTVAEEMAYLRRQNDRLTAVVGHLLTNPLGTTQATAFTSDLDAMDGDLDIDEQDDDRTVITYTLRRAR